MGGTIDNLFGGRLSNNLYLSVSTINNVGTVTNKRNICSQ